MILMPNKGKLVAISGSTAQCIAQAIEVPIPNASQLIFSAILKGKQRYIICNNVAKVFIDDCYQLLGSNFAKSCRMKKKWVPYVVFFALLLAGYFIYVFAENDFSQTGLPVINDNIPAFSFIDQNGKTITERDLDRKVYVAEYFFTTCKGICPRMNANMRRVFDTYKNEMDFRIVSHTCMPETDSVPLLKAYESKMLNGVIKKTEDSKYTIYYDSTMAKPTAPSNWIFLTGDKKALYSLARNGYMIDNNKPDSTQNIADQFIHTQFFALVDKQARVRGIYDGLKEDEIQKLLKDIKGLLDEKTQTRSLKGF